MIMLCRALPSHGMARALPRSAWVRPRFTTSVCAALGRILWGDWGGGAAATCGLSLLVPLVGVACGRRLRLVTGGIGVNQR